MSVPSLRQCFLDTEFYEYTATLADGRRKRVVDMIGVALIDDKNRSYVGISSEFNRQAAMEMAWFRKYILPALPPESAWKTEDAISRDVLDYIGQDNVEIFYWSATQDALIIENLLGNNQPGIANFLTVGRNIRGIVNLYQTYAELGHPKILPPKGRKDEVHDVLHDAVWLRSVYERLRDYKDSLQKVPEQPVRPAAPARKLVLTAA